MVRNKDIMRVSALFGIAVGIGIGIYQTFILDPMIPALHESVPYWLRVTHIHILGLSIVAFLYAEIVDTAFHSRGRLFAVLFVIGQWGTPLTLYPIMAREIVIFGPIHNLMAIIAFVATVAFAVGYLLNRGTLSDS